MDSTREALATAANMPIENFHPTAAGLHREILDTRTKQVWQMTENVTQEELDALEVSDPDRGSASEGSPRIVPILEDRRARIGMGDRKLPLPEDWNQRSLRLQKEVSIQLPCPTSALFFAGMESHQRPVSNPA